MEAGFLPWEQREAGTRGSRGRTPAFAERAFLRGITPSSKRQEKPPLSQPLLRFYAQLLT